MTTAPTPVPLTLFSKRVTLARINDMQLRLNQRHSGTKDVIYFDAANVIEALAFDLIDAMATISALRATIADTSERKMMLAESLRFVLPMAKGYASINRFGSNQEIVDSAEAVLQADGVSLAPDFKQETKP